MHVSDKNTCIAKLYLNSYRLTASLGMSFSTTSSADDDGPDADMCVDELFKSSICIL